MSHFAELDENNVVLRVIVAEQGFIDSGAVGEPGKWVRTSYSGSIRKNYAGVGYTYDAARDAFIAQQPFASWVLNEATCQWQAPVAYPDDGQSYRWDEAGGNWARS
jgi:hypothetical protein